jgi:hypothetical protein
VNESRSAAIEAASCANCGTALQGPYCHACGQHAHGAARSLGALFEDAWHVLTHLDARLWRTLALLLGRPGELTVAFFGGRRARYLPPFRLYLIVSLVFFASTGLIAALGPDRATLAQALTAANKDDPEAAAALAPWAARDGTHGFDPAACAKIHSDDGERLYDFGRRICERAAVDGGAGILRVLRSNIPRMMFVLLPLIALVMRLMYWHPRRYYVEHLVFFLHVHAAFFLVLFLRSLLQLPIGRLPAVGSSTAVGLAVALYAAWYVYRAMRRYYGQGRALTRGKYVVLIVAYAICLGLTFLGTAILSAMTA